MNCYPLVKSDVSIRRINTSFTKIREAVSIENDFRFSFNKSAEEVIVRCTGEKEVNEITNDLSKSFVGYKNEICKKVNNILKFLESNNIIVLSKTKEKIIKIPDIVNTKFPLMSLQIEIIKRCNLKCVHCYAFEEKIQQDIPIELLYSIIDQFANLGGLYISFSGGEPLLRNDIFDILKYSQLKPLNVGLLTNGTLIDQDVADKIADIGINVVQISLDGSCPKIHDTYRNYKGAFDLTVSAIDYLVNKNVKVEISTVINKMNKDDFIKLVEFCKNRWNIIPGYSAQTAKGRALKDGKKYALERIEYLQKKVEYEKYLLNLDNKNTFEFEVPEKFPMKFYRCGAGVNSLHIMNNGEVKACLDLDFSFGNIKTESLYNIWETTNPNLKKIRNSCLEKVKVCKNCQHLKYCKGGCMAEAFKYWGDIRSPDINRCLYYDMIKNNIKTNTIPQKEIDYKVCKF